MSQLNRADDLAERYMALARTAALAGGMVEAENFYQHAEHYFRLMKGQTAQDILVSCRIAHLIKGTVEGSMAQNRYFDVPQQLRELAERNVEQARGVYCTAFRSNVVALDCIACNHMHIACGMASMN